VCANDLERNIISADSGGLPFLRLDEFFQALLCSPLLTEEYMSRIFLLEDCLDNKLTSWWILNLSIFAYLLRLVQQVFHNS
jgi:hypothetical protein